METMLESSLLDEMDDDVLRELCEVIDKKQQVRLGAARNGLLINEAVGKWGDWLEYQDIPQPRVRGPPKPRPTRVPEATTTTTTTTPAKGKGKDKGTRRSLEEVHSPMASPAPAEDIFAMDEDPTSPPPVTASGRQTPRTSRPITPLDLRSQSQSQGSALKPGQVPWKSKTVESGRYVLFHHAMQSSDLETDVQCRSEKHHGRDPSLETYPCSTTSNLYS
jgi:hypothetical protein